jgi:aminoglycoside/choline kinase family phosphotransferase
MSQSMMAPRDSVEESVVEVVRRVLGAGGAIGVEELPRGLGLRRFFRVRLEGARPTRLIARVEAPEDPRRRPSGTPAEPALEPVRALLEAQGVPVPARYGGDAVAGVELLEDLGSLTLGNAATSASSEERRRIYTEACDIVVRYQNVREPGGGARVACFERRLDAALFAYKAEFFATWSLPAALGRAPTPGERTAVEEAFSEIAELAAAAPQRLSHRDFQSANVLVRPERSPGQRLCMIDLQGALLAPPEYDLVCLLRDSYVELGDDEVAFQSARIRPLLPDAPDPESFARRFDLLTLTRKGKDHALFLYAAKTRGLSDYLRFVPPTVRALRSAAKRRAAESPRLARLAELVDLLAEPLCGR